MKTFSVHTSSGITKVEEKSPDAALEVFYSKKPDFKGVGTVSWKHGRGTRNKSFFKA